MKSLVILISNSDFEVEIVGPYRNKKIAEEALAKYEEQFPQLNFLILPVNSGKLVQSKRNT